MAKIISDPVRLGKERPLIFIGGLTPEEDDIAYVLGLRRVFFAPDGMATLGPYGRLVPGSTSVAKAKRCKEKIDEVKRQLAEGPFQVVKNSYGWSVHASATDAAEAALDSALRYFMVGIEQAHRLSLWDAMRVRKLAKKHLRKQKHVAVPTDSSLV